VKHDVTCAECFEYPLFGFRWKCLNCDSYNLCTICYMVDGHDLRHTFKRIEREDSKG
ncbi:Hypothetical predicted protein, partial [Mytilus galloprovincialis]